MNSIVSIVVVAVAALIAAVAIDRRRHWLVAIPAAVVVVAIVLSLADVGQPTEAAWMRLALGAGFALIGVLGGSPVVGIVLRFAQGKVPLGEHGGIVVTREDLDDGDHHDRDGKSKRKRPIAVAQREILRGGATIGYLERLALLGALAAGQPSAVAIIIAIKGLGRFSELDGSEARERFIIGTLTSLVWAGTCAAAALLVR
jgi:hypothetical protein